MKRRTKCRLLSISAAAIIIIIMLLLYRLDVLVFDEYIVVLIPLSFVVLGMR